MKHLFQKVGDGQWEDLGDDPVLDAFPGLSEEEIIHELELFKSNLRGTRVQFEIRSIPDRDGVKSIMP